MPEAYVEPMTESLVTGVSSVRCFKCLKLVTVSKCGGCHAIGYCGRECQKADRPRHKWNCLPVMVTEFPGKGRGLVAARDIKMGELIFKERPLIKLAKLPPGIALDPNYLHSLKKQVEDLPKEAKKQFYKLKTLPENLPEEAKKQFYKLKTLPEVDKLLVALGSLSLGAGVEEYLIFTNNCAELNKYLILHLNTALVNHSCAPNASVGPVKPGENVDQSQKILETRAIKDISKGEEVSLVYFKSLKESGTNSQERKMSIKRKYGFECKCDVCSRKVDGQDEILKEIIDLQIELYQAFRHNHIQKRACDWRREVRAADKMVDLVMQLYIGDLGEKLNLLEDLVRAAQMAREKDLQKKALDLWKKMAEDTKLEGVRLGYEGMERVVAQWSAKMKAKKLPKNNEIKEFFPE